MRGESHVFYSLLSAAILSPVLLRSGDPAVLFLSMAGIFIGSLAPDADAADSAIMHGLLGGSGGLKIFRRHTVLILPFFGYLIRYFVYFPVSALAFLFTFGRIKPKHRGLLHSLFGIMTASFLLFVYLNAAIYLISGLILPDLDLSAKLFYPLGIFCTGVFAGSFFHLLEDSCTRSGVCWFFPFKNTSVSGDLLPKSRRNWLIVLVLAAFSFISLFFFSGDITGELLIDIMPFLLFASAWTFVLFISGAEKN
ncbi:MAG: metal-dependent hydrolase [Methanomicrobium sp.]|nr:metal-dependent hydrolase [Methanomicrobium sp.]